MIKHLLIKTYFLFRLWSLDIVTGSLATGLFITKIMGITPPVWWWFVLALSVWIIYTIDHILDGFKTKDSGTAINRHLYHYKNRKKIFVALIITIFINLLLIINFASVRLILYGAFTGLAVGLYLIAVHHFKTLQYFFAQKELVIAIIYVSGIMVGPMTFINKPLFTWQIIIFIVLILLTWAEGIIASWFDYNKDIHDGHVSFTTVYGKKNTRYFLIMLHILIFIILKINIFFIKEPIAFAAIIIEALMNLILLLILLNPVKMAKNDLFRILGELVFWIPALIALLHPIMH